MAIQPPMEWSMRRVSLASLFVLAGLGIGTEREGVDLGSIDAQARLASRNTSSASGSR